MSGSCRSESTDTIFTYYKRGFFVSVKTSGDLKWTHRYERILPYSNGKYMRLAYTFQDTWGFSWAQNYKYTTGRINLRCGSGGSRKAGDGSLSYGSSSQAICSVYAADSIGSAAWLCFVCSSGVVSSTRLGVQPTQLSPPPGDPGGGWLLVRQSET